MAASANDMVVVADIDDDSASWIRSWSRQKSFSKSSLPRSGEKKGAESVKSWDKALAEAAGCKPGSHLYSRAHMLPWRRTVPWTRALNVFMFSDNVTLEDESEAEREGARKRDWL